MKRKERKEMGWNALPQILPPLSRHPAVILEWRHARGRVGVGEWIHRRYAAPPYAYNTFKRARPCFSFGWRICIAAPTRVTEREGEKEMDQRDSIDLEDASSHQPTSNSRGARFIFTSSSIRRAKEIWNICAWRGITSESFR